MNWKPTGAAWTAAIVLACAVNALGDTPLTVKNLRCEYKVDPMGIDVQKPRLSWQLVIPERGVLQTSYEIRVAQSEADLAQGKLLWDSGKLPSEASIQVEYGGPGLKSRGIYLLAGARRRQSRTFVRLEPARALGDGAARACRLEGKMDYTQSRRGRNKIESRATAAKGIFVRQKDRTRSFVCNGNGALRNVAQR